MVYSREVDGQSYTFGVSGRLYKSNVLLYDHQTESLWSQLLRRAISGPMAGKKLKELPSTRTSWKTWRDNHPRTLVLSTDTGFNRDYSVDPYEGYYRGLGIWFPVGDVRTDLAPKDMILGIEINDKARAYPLSILQEKPGIIQDEIDGSRIFIEVSPSGEITAVRDRKGEVIPSTFAYWFAWQAFHPETEVYLVED